MDDCRAGGKRGHGRVGRVETGGLLHNDSLGTAELFALHRRDACAPFMQCKATPRPVHLSKAQKESNPLIK